jgi:hypothetical protein
VRIHDFAVDDRVVGKRCDRDSNQLWGRLRVVDEGDLDEARSDVDSHSSLLPAE